MSRHRNTVSIRPVVDFAGAHSSVLVVVRYTPPFGEQYWPGAGDASADDATKVKTAAAPMTGRTSRDRRTDQG